MIDTDNSLPRNRLETREYETNHLPKVTLSPPYRMNGYVQKQKWLANAGESDKIIL